MAGRHRTYLAEVAISKERDIAVYKGSTRGSVAHTRLVQPDGHNRHVGQWSRPKWHTRDAIIMGQLHVKNVLVRAHVQPLMLHTRLTSAHSKWPVIVGIILGSIIALSILWCLVKCICGGIVDCCCGCCDCCSSRNKNGYQQPAQPPQYPMHNQYYGPQQPMYSAAPMYAPSPMYAPPQMSGGAGYRGAPMSPHDAPKPDALPAFPTHSRDRQYDDVEMGHIQNSQAGQQQGLLSSHGNADYYGQGQQSAAGDLGAMNASPAHNYDSHRQFAPQSLYSQETASQVPNRVTSMRSTQYEPSLYPPSYHTQAQGNHTYLAGGTVSPPPAGQSIGRKPVQGTWRDV